MSGDTLPDLKFAALRAQNLIPGGGGAIPEMTLAWLQANGATSNSIPDAWNEMLATQFTALGQSALYTGHRSDDWYKLLELLGYDAAGDHINSRERLFWGNGGVFGDSEPIWGAIPNYTFYEANDPWILNLKNHCFASPAVTTWTTTLGSVDNPPTDPDGLLVITWADITGAGGPGDYVVTVTANNGVGSTTQTSFQLEAIAGAPATKPIFQSPMPNFYSLEGVEGSGSEVPPAPAAQSIYASDGGVDMNQYVTNPPVTAGTWVVSGPSVVTIDPDTGILSGRIDAAPNTYGIQVGAKNANSPDIGWSPVFNWEVVPAEGWETFWDKATAHPNLNGMLLARTGGDQSYLNHLAETATATGNTAALTGQEWTGSTYNEKDVGYGILLSDAPQTRLIGPLSNVAGLPDNGMLIEASGQVIFRIEAIPFGDTFARILSLSNEHNTPVPGDEPYNRNDFSEIAIHRPDDDVGLTLAVRTRPTNDTDPAAQFNGWHNVTASGLSYSVGSIIDARFRCSATDGLRFWVTIDGVPAATNLHDPTAIPADEQIAAIDYAALGGDVNTGIYESEITVIYSKVVPYGDLPVATIEAWPSWTHPVPVLPADHIQPTFVHEPAGTEPPTNPEVAPGVIFQTDFRNDLGWDHHNLGLGTGIHLVGRDDIPEGFLFLELNTYANYENDGGDLNDRLVKVMDDPDFPGVACLRVRHPDDAPSSGEMKHNIQFGVQMGDTHKGYKDFYIRYNLRWPNNNNFYAGKQMKYNKWMRLEANSCLPSTPEESDAWAANPTRGSTVHENHAHCEFIIAQNGQRSRRNRGFDTTEYATDYQDGTYNTHYVAYNQNAPTPGSFEYIPGGDGVDQSMIEADTGEGGKDRGDFLNDDQQQYHTIEWHFKANSAPHANDGLWEMWFDGVKQVCPSTEYPEFNQPDMPWDRRFRFVPSKGWRPGFIETTQVELHTGPIGYNWFEFLGNAMSDPYVLRDGPYQPGKDGGIFIRDLVVSTEPIGHDYNVTEQGGFFHEPGRNAQLTRTPGIARVFHWYTRPVVRVVGETKPVGTTSAISMAIDSEQPAQSFEWWLLRDIPRGGEPVDGAGRVLVSGNNHEDWNSAWGANRQQAGSTLLGFHPVSACLGRKSGGTGGFTLDDAGVYTLEVTFPGGVVVSESWRIDIVTEWVGS